MLLLLIEDGALDRQLIQPLADERVVDGQFLRLGVQCIGRRVDSGHS